jgi:hypothetical protein
MPMDDAQMNALTDIQVQEFIANGFVRLDQAFPGALADEGRELLWRDTGCDPHDPTTWRQPVVRLGDYAHPLFRQAANTPLLHAAFDRLVGEGRWLPRPSLGTFPIRFPSPDEPADTGWHAEASFRGDDGSWRLNVESKGRTLQLRVSRESEVAANETRAARRRGCLHARHRAQLKALTK